MSNRHSDQLFVLIKSLKQTEKRYFNLWVQKNGESNTKYFELFERIAKQDSFDDEAILRKSDSIKARQLSNLKAHLYKRLLQALRQFEQEKTEEIQLREQIDYVQVLYNRGLYRQGENMITKAHKKIEKSGHLELKLELLKWEKLVLRRTLGQSYQQKVQRILKEVADTNEKINLINRVTNLAVELNAIYLKWGYIRNDKQLRSVVKLFNRQLPKYNEAELSLYEKLNLYRTLANYYSFLEETEEANLYASKWLKLYDKNPDLVMSQMDDYLQAINQLMIVQYKMYAYDAFMQNSRRLRDIGRQHRKHKNLNIRNRIEKYIYVHEFNRIFMLGDFDIGVRLLSKIGDDLEAFIERSDEHSRVILYYKIACLYVGNSQYSEALEWLNRVQDETQEDLREDVLSFARILSLIAHYELGNTEVMEYYIRSTYRFLLKKGDLNQYQKYILAFLRKLASGFKQEDLLPEFKLLLAKLKPLQEIRYEQRAFIYFDIISWLESKLENTQVGEVIREKALRKINK